MSSRSQGILKHSISADYRAITTVALRRDDEHQQEGKPKSWLHLPEDDVMEVVWTVQNKSRGEMFIQQSHQASHVPMFKVIPLLERQNSSHRLPYHVLSMVSISFIEEETNSSPCFLSIFH